MLWSTKVGDTISCPILYLLKAIQFDVNLETGCVA